MVHSKEKIDLQRHPEQIQPSDLLDKDFKIHSKRKIQRVNRNQENDIETK